LILPETLFAPARNVIGSGGIDPVVNNGAAMTEAQLMTELAESCRRLACYQRNPNVLDMLHDLEEDFIQAAAKRETETSGGHKPTSEDVPTSGQRRVNFFFPLKA
jgi:hypothetical protein